METRPSESTREKFVGQPLKVELYETRLKAVVGGRTKKTGRRLHVKWRLLVWGAFATTVHRWRRSTFERR